VVRRRTRCVARTIARLHKADGLDEAGQGARRICDELTVHAALEEEIFYPAVRAAIDDDLIDEAEVEHATAKYLIAQIGSMSAGEDKFAAKVCVLGEDINYHVEEEHKEMFPKAKRAKIDLQDLATRMQNRKRELRTDMGIEADLEDAPRRATRTRSSRTAYAAGRA